MNDTGEAALHQPQGGSEHDAPSGQMSRGAQTAWIVGAVLVAGLFIAVAIAIDTSANRPASPSKISTSSGSDHGLEPQPVPVAEDVVIPGSELANPAAYTVDDAVTSSPAPRVDPVDRELEMGMRHSIELNEMICRETGQNCELVNMMRRQHEERYGGH